MKCLFYIFFPCLILGIECLTQCVTPQTTSAMFAQHKWFLSPLAFCIKFHLKVWSSGTGWTLIQEELITLQNNTIPSSKEIHFFAKYFPWALWPLTLTGVIFIVYLRCILCSYTYLHIESRSLQRWQAYDRQMSSPIHPCEPRENLQKINEERRIHSISQTWWICTESQLDLLFSNQTICLCNIWPRIWMGFFWEPMWHFPPAFSW